MRCPVPETGGCRRWRRSRGLQIHYRRAVQRATSASGLTTLGYKGTIGMDTIAWRCPRNERAEALRASRRTGASDTAALSAAQRATSDTTVQCMAWTKSHGECGRPASWRHNVAKLQPRRPSSANAGWAGHRERCQGSCRLSYTLAEQMGLPGPASGRMWRGFVNGFRH